MKINYLLLCLAICFISCKNYSKKNNVEFPNKQKQVSQSDNDLFKSLEIKKPPITDSTNFDNFKNQNKIEDSLISQLNLKTLNEHAKNFYADYWIAISKDFRSLVITTKSETEMKTFLVNLSNQNEIIDKLEISYDEIAESMMYKIGTINQDNVKIETYLYSSDSLQVSDEIYKIDKKGEFLLK